MELLAFPKTFPSPILHLLITTTSTTSTTTIRLITKYNYTIATAFYALENGKAQSKGWEKTILDKR